MSEETPFAGLFVKKADPEVLKDLDARGLLLTHLNLNIVIHIAGDVIHHLFTMHVNHGLLR